MQLKDQPRPLRVSLHRVRHTLATLSFGTLLCVGMMAARCWKAHNFKAEYLGWNLFLAWIPAALSLGIWLNRTPTPRRRLLSWLAVVLWILFFPNTFYIVTDFVHRDEFGTSGVPYWFDLLMVSANACGGMFLGCLSLYLMHLRVRERHGWKIGWLFAATMLALSSVGIYLGRFWRLNSWDAIYRPVVFVFYILRMLVMNPRDIAPFSITFFFFSLTVYCFVVSMARLHDEEDDPKGPSGRGPEGTTE